MGLKVSWTLIAIGLFGKDEIPQLLWREEVLDYLDSLLTDINEQTEMIITLICNKDQPEEFDSLIRKLAANDGYDIDVQKRKWRAYMLKLLVDSSSLDYFEGLMNILDFWITQMHAPNDCPLVFPANREEAKNFFNQASYDTCMNRCKAWLSTEISEIVMLESQIYKML
ncbi:MAG: DUF2247 family protein [Clostridia bacterium]|nr:DUF2247 family protein [Clostridia bacterium]